MDAYIPFWEMAYLLQNQCAPIQSLQNICYSLACGVGCVGGTGLEMYGGPSHPSIEGGSVQRKTSSDRWGGSSFGKNPKLKHGVPELLMNR